ncbi:MAG: molybdenum cofactor guanylyltransferase [Planctomycetota bacterium]|jgi:molybdopterin-guanine dinucleotide biosynthesis protein A
MSATAGIVLCGGRSRRMGQDKAALPFGDETLLARTVRLMREVVDEVVVVAREGQDLPGEYRVARDPAPGFGPLAGLATGLQAIEADRAFLSSCDVPFILPAYVQRMIELSEGYAVTVPWIGDFYMTTSAVYSREILPIASGLLAARRLRPLYLVQAVEARIVTAEELKDVDPQLQSFRNCNTPEAYEHALRDAGLAQ